VEAHETPQRHQTKVHTSVQSAQPAAAPSTSRQQVARQASHGLGRTSVPSARNKFHPMSAEVACAFSKQVMKGSACSRSALRRATCGPALLRLG
jgi:hypothetical protein